MKILLVGASGTLGKAIHTELKDRHEIITAGRNSGQHKVDITDTQSVKGLFKAVGKIDAVACAAGGAAFGPLESLTYEQFASSLNDKLMGQVRLVLEGRNYVNPGGSFTLINGVLTDDPIRNGVALSMVNGALQSFVIAAAIELPNQQRINVVSPNVFVESLEGYGPYFRGFEAVPVKRAALAFSKSIEGAQTGQVYKVL